MPAPETVYDTPVMRQYQELKSGYPEAFLFFRLGDFYEMFGSDAQAAAPLCGLVLTSRQGVPMCGVPHHNSQHYVAKLLRAGHKVAIAEQMEDPSKTKKLVRRAVTRLITPGTVIEDELLEPTSTNFLVAIELDVVGWGASALDASTGEFWATQALNDRGARKLLDLLARVNPAEVLAAPHAAETLRLKSLLPARTCLTLYDGAPELDPKPSWAHAPVWVNHHLATRAALKCRRYVAEAQFHLKEVLTPSFRESTSEMQLDETAIRTLELVESPSGERRHTLWGLLDCCCTPMGSRKLKDWLLHPSLDLPEIELRQNCVEELVEKPEARRTLAGILRELSDLPRVTSRLATRQAGPRDLAALRHSLSLMPRLCVWLSESSFLSGLSTLAERVRDSAGGLKACHDNLAKTLSDNPPARLIDGHLIREGVSPELDELRFLKSDSQGFLQRLEGQERQATGIPSLKAGYNSVFGCCSPPATARWSTTSRSPRPTRPRSPRATRASRP